MRSSRRRLLAVLSGSVAALAGCPETSPAPESPADTPTDTPTATEIPTDTPTETGTPTDGGSANEVTVGPGGEFRFDPPSLTIAAGETVRWVWDSSNHNVVPNDVPADSSWGGEPNLSNAGHTHSHTFEVTGEYSYYCEPHRDLGMEGTLTVE